MNEDCCEHIPKSAGYIPAFHFSFLTPLYDFIMQLTMRESTFKRRLIEQASIQRKSRVLDVGCGTATLLILMKQSHPEAEVVGLDGDQKILQIAKSKVEKATLDIALHNGIASALPYHEASFDRVTSSLVLHHLSREQKIQALREALRVLKPNGELHIADFGKPQNFLMRLLSFIVGHLEETSDSLKGLVPKIVREAGFEEVEETGKYMTTYGTLCLYRARKTEKHSSCNGHLRLKSVL